MPKLSETGFSTGFSMNPGSLLQWLSRNAKNRAWASDALWKHSDAGQRGKLKGSDRALMTKHDGLQPIGPDADPYMLAAMLKGSPDAAAELGSQQEGQMTKLDSIFEGVRVRSLVQLAEAGKWARHADYDDPADVKKLFDEIDELAGNLAKVIDATLAKASPAVREVVDASSVLPPLDDRASTIKWLQGMRRRPHVGK